ncbi:uncharacterized protein LOC109720504 isoform X2 [Ananas comosus]|uniref:Uncharacterized protein LOC109720504 isoform X2 n=1 Tax=Ananas comosus TaxID=4615 RepID=A0A6P5G5X8_ANACO|nr:uncharacterized protein LOC109720504 isoform X2 [Ananas comosus]
MESNADSEVTNLHGDITEASETTVEIKVKTLDSKIYTLRVNKCLPVPLLKEKIANVTGVVSEQQRLICRGKVLKDDELLSAYHVEDGHTLHLVVRQPHQSSSSPSTGNLGHEGASSNSAHQHGGSVTRSIVFEAVNIDQGDHQPPHLSQIISSILNSIGAANNGSHNLGTSVVGTRTANDTGHSDSNQPRPSPASLRVELDSQQTPLRFQSGAPLGSQQPSVIPDSLTTIYQYLDFMREEFRRAGFNISGSAQGVDGAGGAGMHSRQGGLPSLESLAEVMQATRHLLTEQAGLSLNQIARQLEDHVNVSDPSARTNLQADAIRAGMLLQNLGSLLLELGRTTMMLRTGQSPSEAAINAGAAVFISASGPNPLLVQPVPFFPGSNVGHMGAVYPSVGLQGLQGEPLGSLFRPRNIDIRIRAGRAVPVANPNPGEQTNTQQPQERANTATNPSNTNASPQIFSGAASTAPLAGEPGVRVLPLRTVVAVPSGVNLMPSDSSGSAVGLIYPLLARIQSIHSGNVSDARGSRLPNEPVQTEPNINGQPNVVHAAQTQNAESSLGGAQTNSNNFHENTEPQVSGFNLANESAAYQDQQEQPHSNSENNSQPHVEPQQIDQGPMSQLLNGVDQLLRTVFSGEAVHSASTAIPQDTVTVSVADQMGTRSNEASGVDEEGILFSNLIRHIMPFISQGTEADQNGSSTAQATTERLSESRENINESSGSQPRRDPPEDPNPKRPKTE